MTKKGFFNIFRSGNKDLEDEVARQTEHAISMAKKEDDQVALESDDANHLVTSEIVTFASQKLEILLRAIEDKAHVKFQKRNQYKLYLSIEGAEDMGRVIGKDGATLRALQVLVAAFVVREFSTHIQLFIDAGGYRSRHSKKLKQRVERLAQDVVREDKTIELEAMNAMDRRTVHMMFENDKTVSTHSVGEGATRHVVMTKKDGSSIQPDSNV